MDTHKPEISDIKGDIIDTLPNFACLRPRLKLQMTAAHTNHHV